MQETATTRPEDVGLCSKRIERLEKWMDQLVSSGRLAGNEVMINRRGRTAFHRCHGKRDVARNADATPETIYRIYSMTKPLTAVAVMMLYEEGRFQLDDPITRYLPEFKGQRVYTGGGYGAVVTEPAVRDITFRDLLTHTSGLTYGFMQATPVDAIYREQKLELPGAEGPLGDIVARLAKAPLIAQPGTEWNYSIASDVLGHLVAVISGQPFDAFLRERVIRPLDMADTDFFVPSEKVKRFAANYERGPDGRARLIDDPETSRFLNPPKAPSGGGGLVGTARDYMRFCQMLLRRGVHGSERLLGRKTVELMTINHLAGDMAAMGQPRFAESNYHGIGFGLGFSVVLDPAKAQIVGSPGECAWGGVASTAFFVDPQEDLAIVMMTQLTPSSTYPIRRELRVLVYQSIID
ncbi:MAG TPA: serine hydrolase domain-containing protein [Hyphomicrobiaceae bacterium]|jgi:CubicO group peptidase (beta-lactamase class C family)|nr:serine hydrolase domain-containing protein [Hyphomicrobiaceae bacterium]